MVNLDDEDIPMPSVDHSIVELDDGEPYSVASYKSRISLLTEVAISVANPHIGLSNRARTA